MQLAAAEHVSSDTILKMNGAQPSPSVPSATSTAVHIPTPTSRKNILPPLAEVKASESEPASPSLSEHEPVALQCAIEADPLKLSSSKESASSLKNFRGIGQAVVLGLKVTNGFSTLRDRGGVTVLPGDLRTVRKLGEGAFAVVEEAVYTPTATATPIPALTPPSPGPPRAPAGPPAAVVADRRVAVKRLKPHVVDREGDLQAFVSEVALLRKLANKRIVEFIGVGSTDTSSEEARRRTLFLVQEFMDGGSLKRVLSRQMIDVTRQQYTYADGFRWALQIAEGLEYLHSARPLVIHRDLKLENILLKGTDPHTADAKISDFGLVALIRPRERSMTEHSMARSAAGTQERSGFSRFLSMKRRAQTIHEVWDHAVRTTISGLRKGVSVPPQQLSGRTGSYMYMAPEMYRQEQYNEKVDVFSFGVIVFEILNRYQMVCAVSVAGTEEEIENYAAKVADGYRPPLPDTWPPGVRELIANCWDQDPAARPSMSWVRERLAQLQAEGAAEEMQRSLRTPYGCACAIM